MMTRRSASQFQPPLDGESMLTIRIAKRRILEVLVVIGLLSLPLVSADPKDAAPPAPVPSPIAAARKVFISNAPGSNLPPSLGGPDRTYNEFYAAMKGWGHYELVASPSDADLILEISFTSSLSGVGGSSMRDVLPQTTTNSDWWSSMPRCMSLCGGSAKRSTQSSHLDIVRQR